MTVFHGSAAEAEAALDEAFASLERVERVMSLYRADSQLSRLNRDGLLEDPDSWLLEVLGAARRISERSGGAFDVTVQPLWELYEAAAAGGGLPGADELGEALGKVDWRRVEITPGRVNLRGRGTAVTLNGIAQGFAADVVGRTLGAHGIRSALIDTGEIGSLGGRPDTGRWTVGIRHPREAGHFIGMAALRGLSLSTSGDYETRFGEGYRDHHLIDPRTGRSPVEFSSVSVAAPTALEADALSTAVFLMGPEKGRALVESTPGAEALFVGKNGTVTRTGGFPEEASSRMKTQWANG